MRGHPLFTSLVVGTAVIFALSGCASSGATSQAPAIATPTPSATLADAAQAAAQRWLAALQAKDLEAMAALWAPDGTWEDGATGESFTGGPQAERAGWSEALGMMIAAKDASILALGDGVAVVVYTFHGPTPAHSSPVDVPTLAVLRVKNARITGETIYYNPELAYGS